MTITEPLCASPSYDPNWWSIDHPGRCERNCPNRLAAHICSHCPFMYACQDQISSNPEQWVGVVLGGLSSVRSGSRYNRRYDVEVVPDAGRCSTCQPELARVR